VIIDETNCAFDEDKDSEVEQTMMMNSVLSVRGIWRCGLV